MKLSCTIYSMNQLIDAGKMDVKGFIEYCGKLKLDAVDLGYYWKNEDEEVSQAPKWLKENNIELGAYIVGNEFSKKDKKERREAIDLVKHGIDRANQLGTDILRIFAGYIREGFPSYEASKAILLDCFKEVCEYAGEKKVTLAFENHGDICAKADQILDFVGLVNSPNLKLCIDIGNFMSVGEDPVESISKLAHLTGYVHVKDNKREGDKAVRTVVGEGDVKLKECLKIIKDSGYQGYYSLEYEAEEDCITGVDRSLANIRKAIKDIG